MFQGEGHATNEPFPRVFCFLKLFLLGSPASPVSLSISSSFLPWVFFHSPFGIRGSTCSFLLTKLLPKWVHHLEAQDSHVPTQMSLLSCRFSLATPSQVTHKRTPLTLKPFLMQTQFASCLLLIFPISANNYKFPLLKRQKWGNHLWMLIFSHFSMKGHQILTVVSDTSSEPGSLLSLPLVQGFFSAWWILEITSWLTSLICISLAHHHITSA